MENNLFKISALSILPREKIRAYIIPFSCCNKYMVHISLIIVNDFTFLNNYIFFSSF